MKIEEYANSQSNSKVQWANNFHSQPFSVNSGSIASFTDDNTNQTVTARTFLVSRSLNVTSTGQNIVNGNKNPKFEATVYIFSDAATITMNGVTVNTYANSIKYSIKISDWPFASNTNQLRFGARAHYMGLDDTSAPQVGNITDSDGNEVTQNSYQTMTNFLVPSFAVQNADDHAHHGSNQGSNQDSSTDQSGKAFSGNPRGGSKPPSNSGRSAKKPNKGKRMTAGPGLVDMPEIATVDGVNTPITIINPVVPANASKTVDIVWVFPYFNIDVVYDPVVAVDTTSTSTDSSSASVALVSMMSMILPLFMAIVLSWTF